MRPLRVFLCHASQDKPAVWRLHRYLTQHGVKPWLDQEDLLPGEDWEVEIPNAIFSSDVILVCLSKNSVNKEGMVQKEISFALDKALEKPGKIFIIPVKLEECDIPKRLSRYQWVEYYRTDGRKRLLMGLNKRVTELGDEVTPVIMEDSRPRTPRPRSPKPETKPEEQTVLIPQKEEIKTEPKPPVGGSSSEAYRDPNDVKQKTPKKPFTKTLDPSSLSPKEIISPLGEVVPSIVGRIVTTYSKSNPTYKRVFGIGGIALIFLLFAAFGGNYLLNNLSVTTPTPGIGSTMISDKDGMTLAYVPAGEFVMGSNLTFGPEHKIYLDAFWVDQTEVTNKMYAQCVAKNKCDPPTKIESYTHSDYYGNTKFNEYPVLYVNWNMANGYCEWAGRRLPTEAEWEKSARGTNTNTYPWGEESPNANLLNFNNNLRDTTEIGTYPNGASIYGALDMAGNVWEWVNDWYSETYYQDSPLSNPLGPDSGTYRVLRGGSWSSRVDDVRTTSRIKYDPMDTSNGIGFRCARSP